MKFARIASLVTALALAAWVAVAGEARFSAKPAATRAGGKTQVTFTVTAKTDVEVAILDAGGKVVRHLAAGVLGGKTPPPAPLKAGLSQKLEWDGKDDFGRPVLSERSESKGPFKIRVRAGMGAKLEKIVGGDPYAYLSDDMNQHNHTVWKMTGLEQKSDGTVYVLGNSITQSGR